MKTIKDGKRLFKQNIPIGIIFIIDKYIINDTYRVHEILFAYLNRKGILFLTNHSGIPLMWHSLELSIEAKRQDNTGTFGYWWVGTEVEVHMNIVLAVFKRTIFESLIKQ